MMKKVILTLTLFVVLLFTANTVSARGIIFYSAGEKIEVAKNLPDSAIINDEHVNLGVMYKQFSIFWIPMWNYGETKYVFVNDKKNTYYDIAEGDIEMLKSDFNVDVPQDPVIGFWNKTGGKIIWGILILLAFFGFLTSGKENKDKEIPKQSE